MLLHYVLVNLGVLTTRLRYTAAACLESIAAAATYILPVHTACVGATASAAAAAVRF